MTSQERETLRIPAAPGPAGVAAVPEHEDSRPTPGTGPRQPVRRPGRWRQRALPGLALGWLALVLIATLAAPLIAPYGANEQDLTEPLRGPSAHHLLGTDNLGRDILSRLLLGGEVTIVGVLLATAVAVVLGSLIGVTAGYLSGLADSVLSAAADILMSIPVIVILLSIAAVTSRNITVLMLTVGVLGSAGVYRVLRAATLELRQELFVTAARSPHLGPEQHRYPPPPHPSATRRSPVHPGRRRRLPRAHHAGRARVP